MDFPNVLARRLRQTRARRFRSLVKLAVPSQATAAVADGAADADRTFEGRRHTADRIFRGVLLFNGALTAFWLVVLTTRGDTVFYTTSNVDAQALVRVGQGILFFDILWGVIWYCVKNLLLEHVAGFSKEDRRQAFSSRMNAHFDVAKIVARHSERRIRIIDMIGRRGRFVTLGAAGFFYLYSRQAADPSPDFGLPAGESVRRRIDRVVFPCLLLCEWLHRRPDVRPANANHGRRARKGELPAGHQALGGVQIRVRPDRGPDCHVIPAARVCGPCSP